MGERASARTDGSGRVHRRLVAAALEHMCVSVCMCVLCDVCVEFCPGICACFPFLLHLYAPGTGTCLLLQQ